MPPCEHRDQTRAKITMGPGERRIRQRPRRERAALSPHAEAMDPRRNINVYLSTRRLPAIGSATEGRDALTEAACGRTFPRGWQVHWCASAKAAEDSRTPKAGAPSTATDSREASWSAAVLCRFGNLAAKRLPGFACRCAGELMSVLVLMGTQLGTSRLVEASITTVRSLAQLMLKPN